MVGLPAGGAISAMARAQSTSVAGTSPGARASAPGSSRGSGSRTGAGASGSLPCGAGRCEGWSKLGAN
eukprot:12818769-Alexandrium_andersonii.AAC.1